MNVLYASNDGYAGLLGVSLYSLLENNQAVEEINIYILDNGISKKNTEKLLNMIERFGRVGTLIDISDLESRFGFEIHSSGYNITTFARLFIDDLLPKEIEKVLYLDSDIIVRDSIESLWNTDISECQMAAVVEVYMPQDKKSIIGLEKEEPYYNAGVLLINRKRFAEDDLKSQFLSYYKEMGGELLYNDQDIINHCCKGKIKAVSPTYNYEPNVYYFPYKYLKRINPFYYMGDKDSYEKLCENPTIIHFLGDERPWVEGNKNPYSNIFWEYQKKSEWSNLPIISGKGFYMKVYHALNILTVYFPWIRTLVTNLIGINKFKWFGKQ